MTKQTEHLWRVRCSWEGCWRSTTRHHPDDWSYLFGWGPAVKDGYYCRVHADALEAVRLDDIERGIDSFAVGRIQ